MSKNYSSVLAIGRQHSFDPNRLPDWIKEAEKYLNEHLAMSFREVEDQIASMTDRELANALKEAESNLHCFDYTINHSDLTIDPHTLVDVMRQEIRYRKKIDATRAKRNIQSAA
jgi:hypothetical protein